MRARHLLVSTIISLSVAGCYPRINVIDIGPIEEATPITALTTAHRGNLHRGLPDNSIPALTEAIAAKVPLLEVDVRRSDTGELFLFHDGSVSFSNSYGACALRHRKVNSLNATERRQVFLNKEHSVSIPDLSEALELIKGSGSRLQLDLKRESDELLRAVIQEVKRYNAEKFVVIQIRSAQRIKLVKDEAPAIAVIVRCKNEEQLISAIDAGADFVELEKWISPSAIDVAHMADIPVLLNIASSRLDDEMTHGYFRSRGVDIIMTDHAADW
jgi:glycerophosphoryl diester phosphodiesterase